MANKEKTKSDERVAAPVDLLVSTLVIAFVQGAKWWEFRSVGGTMWHSDQEYAEKESLRRDEEGTLGKLPKWY